MSIELDDDGDLLPHYDLDYSKSKPNRFAEKYQSIVSAPVTEKPADEASTTVSQTAEGKDSR